jgi:hypothetical protein
MNPRSSCAAALLLALPALAAHASPARFVVSFPAIEEPELREAGVEVWTRGGGSLVGGADADALEELAA